VKRLIEKFREVGLVGDAKHTGRPKTSSSNVNVVAVHESFAENPRTPIRRRGQELQITRSSIQRILTKDLCLNAYKIQLVQQLKPNDHAQRREFMEWIIEHQQVDADFSSKVMFSDEAHFYLDGFANRQNCRI